MSRAEDRFWSKVNKTKTCWLWTGCKSGSFGYGAFFTAARKFMAHRFSYELSKGPIPEGLQLDHLCRTPSCVNPDHLEAVTARVNTLRGIGPTAINARRDKCVKGHDDWESTSIGTRKCRTCMSAHSQRRYKSLRSEERIGGPSVYPRQVHHVSPAGKYACRRMSLPGRFGTGDWEKVTCKLCRKTKGD